MYRIMQNDVLFEMKQTTSLCVEIYEKQVCVCKTMVWGSTRTSNVCFK
jgi:hypothetical protein